MPYCFFPNENGTYRCLIMCLICCFIVMKNSMNQYMRSMGQKTGTSKIGTNVMKNAMTKLLMDRYQNLNSGSLLTKGLNSSLPFVGRVGPSVAGSTCGERNPMTRLRLYMPRPYVTM